MPSWQTVSPAARRIRRLADRRRYSRPKAATRAARRDVVWPRHELDGLARFRRSRGSTGAGARIVRRAEELGIPWQRLLLDEIEAEVTLRRRAGDAGAEMPLATALTLLPFSFLRSWRVRDLIQALSCEARSAAFQTAVRDLRMVSRHLIGRPGGGRASFSGRLWLAYQRVLLLQRACRAASKSRGTSAERLAFVCARTRCCFDDAAWALGHEDAPRPGHRLDAAMRKARRGGFRDSEGGDGDALPQTAPPRGLPTPHRVPGSVSPANPISGIEVHYSVCTAYPQVVTNAGSNIRRFTP